MKTLIHSTFLACILFCLPESQAKKQPATITLEANRPSGDCRLAPYEFDAINTRYEVILPISIDAAKQLFVDSSAPLGFRFPKKIKDKLKVIARSTDRSIKLNKGLEGQLALEFQEISSGNQPATRSLVNTTSLEMIGKKRDHSVAGAIVKRAICFHFLFSDLVSNSDKQVMDTIDGLPKDLAIPLYLKNFVNSRLVDQGDTIAFVVKEDVIVDDRLLVRKGAPGWGKVTEAKEAKLFGFKGNLSIVIETVEAANGESLKVQANNEELESQIEDRRSFPKGYVPPILYLFAAGGQPNIMAGSEHTVFVQ